MSPFRKSRLHRLAVLRVAVSVVQHWDRTWGTPFFTTPPNALDVLGGVERSLRRDYDIVIADHFLRLAINKAVKRQEHRVNLEPVFGFFRQHHLSYADPDAYPEAMAAADTELMRDRILLLARRMDWVFPGEGLEAMVADLSTH